MFLSLLKRALPLPKITDGNTYLFVAAHPDDIEVGAGGTVAKLVEMGKKVHFAIITDGGCGSKDLKATKADLVITREAEALAASRELGVETVRFLGFPDAGDYRDYDVAQKLARIILEINPDFVFAPDPNLPSEIHQDHVKAGNATKTAVLFSGYPLVFQENVGPVETNSLPAFRFRNLGFYFTHRSNSYEVLNPSHVKARKHAIMCHESQFPDLDELNQILRYLKLRGWIFGAFGKRSKEGFFVLGNMHLHCFPEVNRY